VIGVTGMLPAVRSLADFLAGEWPKLTVFDDGKSRS
jgi:hypothetical protein